MWSGIGREEHDKRRSIELTIYSQHPLLGQASSKQRFGEKKEEDWDLLQFFVVELKVAAAEFSGGEAIPHNTKTIKC